MQTNIVAEYLASTPEDSKARRKMDKAIKRFHRIKAEHLKHARADFHHAKKDLADATAAFKSVIDHFTHAVGDVSEKGRDPQHIAEDYGQAVEEFVEAEGKIKHALKDFRHALKDFAEAVEDLERIGKASAQIAAAANEAGQKAVTPELVRLAIKKGPPAQAKPDEPVAAAEPAPEAPAPSA